MKKLLPFLFSFFIFLFFATPSFADFQGDFTVSNVNFDPATGALSLNYSGIDLSQCSAIYISPYNSGPYPPLNFLNIIFYTTGGPNTGVQCDSSSITATLVPNSLYDFSANFPPTSYIIFHVSGQNGQFLSYPISNPSYTQTNLTPGQFKNTTVNLESDYRAGLSAYEPNMSAISWTATVDYGDGSPVQTLTQPIGAQAGTSVGFAFDHQYSAVGTYTVTASITNNFGATTGPVTAQITVANPIQVSSLLGGTVNVGNIYSENGSFTDPNPDATSWTATVNYGDKSGIKKFALTGQTFNLNHIYNRVGNFPVVVTITDNLGATGTASATVTVNNSSYNLTGTVYNDDNQNGTQDTGETGVAEGTVTLNTGQTATTDANGNYSIPNLPAGSYTETLTVPTGYMATTTNPATVAVSANTTENFGIYSKPTVGTITASPAPVKINTAASTNATFTDGDTTDTHTATWNWGDGSTSTSGIVTEPNGSTPGSVTGSHTYTNLGSYTITLTVTDNEGQSGTSQYVISVIPTNGLSGGNLSHTNYSGADFSNQNISKANLSVATFNNVNFQNANLSQVNGSNSSFTNDDFTGANLNKVNMSNSNLTGSNFTNAIITGANLSNANLTNINFTGANLQGANLSGTTKTGIIWSNTTCPNGTNSNNDGGTCVGQGGGL